MTDPTTSLVPETLLKEVGRVGSAEAAASLSRLLGRPTIVEVVRVAYVAPVELASRADRGGELFIATYFAIFGRRMGSVLLLLSRAHACRLIEAASARPGGTVRALDEYGLSLVREIGNIMTGAYLGAIRAFVPMPLVHSIPYVAIDQWDTILNSLIPSLADSATTVGLIESELRLAEVEALVYITLFAGDWLGRDG